MCCVVVVTGKSIGKRSFDFGPQLPSWRENNRRYPYSERDMWKTFTFILWHSILISGMRKKRVDQIPWQGFYWSAWVWWVPLGREKCFTGKFRLSSLALKLFSNCCGIILPWMPIWIHRFSSCRGISVHCHFYSISSGKYLYLIVFFPQVDCRLQISLPPGFASACTPLFRHDLALQGKILC